MANKNRVTRPKYILAGDMSDDVVGPWLWIKDLDNVGFQAVWTTGATGTFTAEVSEDEPTTTNNKLVPDGRLGPTALTLPASMTVAAALPSNSAGNFYFGFNQMECPWIRFSYKHTSGSGTLNVGASAKEV